MDVPIEPVLPWDRRVRVFVSSTLEELAPERAAVRAAVERLRLTPVMFELGRTAAPAARAVHVLPAAERHLPRAVRRVVRLGRARRTISGLEDEYLLAARPPAAALRQEPGARARARLTEMIERIWTTSGVSTAPFRDADGARRRGWPTTSRCCSPSASAPRPTPQLALDPEPLPHPAGPLVGRERRARPARPHAHRGRRAPRDAARARRASARRGSRSRSPRRSSPTWRPCASSTSRRSRDAPERAAGVGGGAAGAALAAAVARRARRPARRAPGAPRARQHGARPRCGAGGGRAAQRLPGRCGCWPPAAPCCGCTASSRCQLEPLPVRDAEELFAQRARLVRPDFAVDRRQRRRAGPGAAPARGHPARDRAGCGPAAVAAR